LWNIVLEGMSQVRQQLQPKSIPITSISIPILANNYKSKPKSSKASKVLPKRYMKDKRTFFQGRITLEEYEKLLPLAQECFNNGVIKKPTISALARSCLMTQANIYFQNELRNEQIRQADERRKQLQAMTKEAPSKIIYPNIADSLKY
jgi:hypothetical protein